MCKKIVCFRSREGGFDVEAHSGDIMDIEEQNGRAGLARIIMNNKY